LRIDVNICEFIAGPSPGFEARERNVNWGPHVENYGMADGLTEILLRMIQKSFWTIFGSNIGNINHQ
jgi:hypothetical protein